MADSSTFADTLTQTATAFRQRSRDRPSPETLVDALLSAEKATKQARSQYPFEALLGDWRLCFATGTRKVRQRGGIVLGKGFYVPAIAHLSLSFRAVDSSDGDKTNRGEIVNQVRLGSLQLQLTGPCRYQSPKNLLPFDFTQVQVRLLKRLIYSGAIRSGKADQPEFDDRPIAQLPFFAFVWVTKDCLAARGRGGGLALWIRDR